MAQQIDSHLFKGMSKDLGEHVFNTELLVDAHNIRIKTDEQNSTYIITNEKGPEEVTIDWSDCYYNNWIGPSLGVVPMSFEGEITNTSFTFNIYLYNDINYFKKHIHIEYTGSKLNDSFSYVGTLTTRCSGKEEIERNITISVDNDIIDLKNIKVENVVYLGNISLLVEGLKEASIKTIDTAFKISTSTLISVGERAGSISRFIGTILGNTVIENYIVVFTHDKDTNIDYIYRLEQSNDTFKAILLYSGNLNFDEKHPIETITNIENELVYKVYWVDGKNILRFINILADSTKFTSTSFDTNVELSTNEIMHIESVSGQGNLDSGVIQYAFTYVNKYGQESAPVLVSPLHYIYNTTRGGSPEEKGNNAFKIRITGLKDNTSLIRLYAISRSSLNADVVVRLIGEQQIEYKEYINKLDTNISETVVEEKSEEEFINTAKSEFKEDIYSTPALGIQRFYNNIGFKRLIKNDEITPALEIWTSMGNIYNKRYLPIGSDDFIDYVQNSSKSYNLSKKILPTAFGNATSKELYMLEYYFNIKKDGGDYGNSNNVGYSSGCIALSNPEIPNEEKPESVSEFYEFYPGCKSNLSNKISYANSYLTIRSYFDTLVYKFEYNLIDSSFTYHDGTKVNLIVKETDKQSINSEYSGFYFKYNGNTNRLEYPKELLEQGVASDNLNSNKSGFTMIKYKKGEAPEDRPCDIIHIVTSEDYSENNSYTVRYAKESNTEVVEIGDKDSIYTVKVIDDKIGTHIGGLHFGNYIGKYAEGGKLYLAVKTDRIKNAIDLYAKDNKSSLISTETTGKLNVGKSGNNIVYGEYTIIGEITEYTWELQNTESHKYSSFMDVFVTPMVDSNTDFTKDGDGKGKYILNLSYFNNNDICYNGNDLDSLIRAATIAPYIRKAPYSENIILNPTTQDPYSPSNIPIKYEGTDIIKIWEDDDLKEDTNVWFPYRVLPKEVLGRFNGAYGSEEVNFSYRNRITIKDDRSFDTKSAYSRVGKVEGNTTTFNYCLYYPAVSKYTKTLYYKKNSSALITRDVDNQTDFIDNGEGEIVDSTKLLFLTGDKIIPNTFANKDNTLFLGNIKYNKVPESLEKIKSLFKNKSLFTTYLPTRCLVENSISENNAYNYENYLHLSSKELKGFKYLDTYRFGVILIDKYGNSSSPIFIGDFKIDNAPKVFQVSTVGDTDFLGNLYTSFGYYVKKVGVEINLDFLKEEDSKNIIEQLIEKGYTKIRPIVVFPKIEDRECLAQGVVNPTVFNVENRFKHSPDVQASWFFRPEPSQDIQLPYENSHEKDDGRSFGFEHSLLNKDSWKVDGKPSSKSKAAMFWCGGYKFAQIDFPYGENDNNWNMLNWGFTKSSEFEFPSYSHGSWVEFRHWYPIPDYMSRCAEIQGLRIPEYDYCCFGNFEEKITSAVANRRNHFYIDKNVVTLNSPEIELSDDLDNLNKNAFKFRIIGRIPIVGNTSKAKVSLSTATAIVDKDNAKNVGIGFVEQTVNNRGYAGWRILSSAPMFIDNRKDYQRNYVLYPWHHSGSLSSDDDNTGPSILKTKKISNLRYSRNSVYEKNTNNDYIMWTPLTKEIALFNSNEISLCKVGGLSYYGNIDTLLTQPSFSGDEDRENQTRAEGFNFIVANNITTQFKEINVGFGNTVKTNVLKPPPYLHDGISADVKCWGGGYANANSWKRDNTDDTTPDGADGKGPIIKTSGVRMKYKSTKHAVIGLHWQDEGYNKSMTVLPYATIRGTSINNIDNHSYDINHPDGVGSYFYSTPNIRLEHIKHDNICELENLEDWSTSAGFLWLGEIYKEVENRFGGTSEFALENNLWETAGEDILLETIVDNNVETPRLIWSEGDTYYQRYDCLKTYPFSNEDVNQVTEILSFMCETRVNLDGRYDANRGLEDNTNVTPENFNKLNPVYNQSNNYFTYRILDEDYYRNTEFKSDIMWSMSKTGGETVDPWLQIPANSKYTLDGRYGSVNAIKKYNDALLVFQDSAVSAIQFNERAAISTSDGVPIEIANTGKMQGVKYLDTNVGCCNKWAIAISGKALYFLDANNSSLMSFSSEGVKNLTASLGMTSWAKDNDFFKKYTPKDYEGFRLFADKNSQDIYIVNNKETLLYSELLGQFVSFLDYKNIADGFNLYSNFYTFHDNKLWEFDKGEYNKLFDEYYPYSISFISNKEFNKTKTFNNILVRGDLYNQAEEALLDLPFTKVDIKNSYQEGTTNPLTNDRSIYSMRRKFKLWGINVPREKGTRNRIKDFWTSITLSNTLRDNKKLKLYNVDVAYT